MKPLVGMIALAALWSVGARADQGGRGLTP